MLTRIDLDFITAFTSQSTVGKVKLNDVFIKLKVLIEEDSFILVLVSRGIFGF